MIKLIMKVANGKENIYRYGIRDTGYGIRDKT